MSENVTFTIDGQTITVPKGTTVYTAAKSLGIDIPIFCYQDRMPPFGACRVCLVEVEKMGKLQTSCTLFATEGMVVKTQSQIAKEGREIILEFLLINHPLDCPICDRGGECPLQDLTVKFGPGKSRFFEEKRHFVKPKPLGPVLTLDRERCITCARCTRFGDIVAGDNALEFIDRGYKTEVGTADGGVAKSKFIGNTIMICPVGALTSTVYRFRARPWDNQSTETTCTLCPVGCSMILDQRDGEIVRTQSKENRAVNDIWLCDKGWFGYEFSSHPDRLKNPLIRRGERLEPASWEEALKLIATKMVEMKPGGKLAGLGGNPLTFEENYLFQKLMRQGAGVNNVDHRIGLPVLSLEEEGVGPGMEMTIGECEELSHIFLFGCDLTEEFPVIWLRLKAAINRGAKSYFFGYYSPEISRHLTQVVLHPPGEEGRILEQIAFEGEKVALFIGRQYLDSPNRKAILSRFLSLRQRFPNIVLNLMEGRGNSMGARFAGMRPDLGPFEERLKNPGMNVNQILQNSWDFIYVAGANLPTLSAKFLVVQDLFLNETAKKANVVLPTLSFIEKEGHFVNIEGRLQTLRPGRALPEGIYSDGEIFVRLAKYLNLELHLDPKLLLKERLEFKRPETIEGGPIVAQKGLKIISAPALFDHGVRMQHNLHLIQLAKEPMFRIHPNEAEKHSWKEGEVVRINEKVGKIKLDPNVAPEMVVWGGSDAG